MALSKHTRLTRTEFSNHFKLGKRYHSSTMTIIHSPFPSVHVSVVVGKKIHKKAVDRNKIRRRVYGVIQTLIKKETLHGVFIVVIKPAFSRLTRKEQLVETRETVGQICKST